MCALHRRRLHATVPPTPPCPGSPPRPQVMIMVGVKPVPDALGRVNKLEVGRARAGGWAGGRAASQPGLAAPVPLLSTIQPPPLALPPPPGCARSSPWRSWAARASTLWSTAPASSATCLSTRRGRECLRPGLVGRAPWVKARGVPPCWRGRGWGGGGRHRASCRARQTYACAD